MLVSVATERRWERGGQLMTRRQRLDRMKVLRPQEVGAKPGLRHKLQAQFVFLPISVLVAVGLIGI
jgi:hypothetical protein